MTDALWAHQRRGLVTSRENSIFQSARRYVISRFHVVHWDLDSSLDAKCAEIAHEMSIWHLKKRFNAGACIVAKGLLSVLPLTLRAQVVRNQ